MISRVQQFFEAQKRERSRATPTPEPKASRAARVTSTAAPSSSATAIVQELAAALQRPGTRWVFLDETNGAPCASGERMTPAALALIAQAVELQNHQDRVPVRGGLPISCRVGASASDIRPGECVYAFRAKAPEAPGAVAYHDRNGKGVPFAVEAFTLCASLFGRAGALSAATHEVNEAEGNPGANRWADNGSGKQFALEDCDAVEMQEYALAISGRTVFVSNFLLPSFFAPGAPPPYSFMTLRGLPGAVECPGPMQCAPGHGGNYQIVQSSPRSESTVTAARAHELQPHIEGAPRRPAKVAHWNSRAARMGVAPPLKDVPASTSAPKATRRARRATAATST